MKNIFQGDSSLKNLYLVLAGAPTLTIKAVEIANLLASVFKKERFWLQEIPV